MLSYIISIAVIQTITKSNLPQKGFTWLKGYSSSLRVAGAGTQEGAEAETMEEHGACSPWLDQFAFLYSIGLPS